jgi:hypothetical protein
MFCATPSVRSVQAYVSVVWDPYLTRDIDKLERIDRNGARFITGDYKSRHEGAVTNMLNDLDLPTLQDRRTNAKLVFLYRTSAMHAVFTSRYRAVFEIATYKSKCSAGFTGNMS